MKLWLFSWSSIESTNSLMSTESQRNPRELLVFCLHWNMEEVGSSQQQNIILPVRVRASRHQAEACFLHVLYVGCHQKMWHRFRVGLTTSNDPIKKISHNHAHLPEFSMIPDVAKLTAKSIQPTKLTGFTPYPILYQKIMADFMKQWMYKLGTARLHKHLLLMT